MCVTAEQKKKKKQGREPTVARREVGPGQQGLKRWYGWDTKCPHMLMCLKTQSPAGGACCWEVVEPLADRSQLQKVHRQGPSPISGLSVCPYPASPLSSLSSPGDTAPGTPVSDYLSKMCADSLPATTAIGCSLHNVFCVFSGKLWTNINPSLKLLVISLFIYLFVLVTTMRKVIKQPKTGVQVLFWVPQDTSGGFDWGSDKRSRTCQEFLPHI